MCPARRQGSGNEIIKIQTANKMRNSFPYRRFRPDHDRTGTKSGLTRVKEQADKYDDGDKTRAKRGRKKVAGLPELTGAASRIEVVDAFRIILAMPGWVGK